jgi:phosphate transport system substrate-binding protein
MYLPRRACLIFLTLAAAVPQVIGAAAAETLRTGGTGGANAMLQKLGAAFTLQTEITVEVIPNLGSGGGIKAVADGLIDFTVSGRPLTREEAAKGLVEVLTTRTPFVIATSNRDAGQILSGDLGRLFGDASARWPDNTPVRAILRPPTETDNTVLYSLFPDTRAAIAKARLRNEVPVAPTDQDNQDLAEQMAGSLIATTLTQTLMEHRRLYLLPINGMAPTLINYENGSYPYGKELHFVFPAGNSSRSESFLAFLRSPQGEQLLRETGNLLGSR